MAESKRYKSSNFDLDTKRLIEVLGKNGRRKAYAQSQRFLERNGFDHRQWSGYITIDRMVYADIFDRLQPLPNCATIYLFRQNIK